MNTTTIIITCVVGSLVAVASFRLRAAYRDKPTAIFRGKKKDCDDTAEIRVYLDPSCTSAKMFINSELVDETYGEGDPRYEDRTCMSIGGGFAFFQKVLVDRRDGMKISLFGGTRGGEWERVL